MHAYDRSKCERRRINVTTTMADDVDDDDNDDLL